LRLPATLLSIAIVAWAAPPAKEAPRPKLPPEVQVAVGLAYASPPEIAADAFLRLAASDHVAGREAKIQILEQAFTLAGEARNKIRERQIAGLPGDTRSGMTDRASSWMRFPSACAPFTNCSSWTRPRRARCSPAWRRPPPRRAPAKTLWFTT
jgi:hypothetical protein